MGVNTDIFEPINIYNLQYAVETLNYYRDMYYNENISEISDYEYDMLFDKLKEMEQQTGVVMSNSPTQSVGYEVKSKLQKFTHNHPMLSLDKTKSIDDLNTFLGDKDGLLMLKLDGLSVTLRYVDGNLVSAATRGNGVVGEDITHNAKVFKNIPLHIPYKDELIVDGEAIITYSDFKDINEKLPESERYKNPRNLVSGSVRQLDSSITAERYVQFVAWKLVKGSKSNFYHIRLLELEKLGFDIVPYYYTPKGNVYNFAEMDIEDYLSISEIIDMLKCHAENHNYPIDGMVLSYDDVAYSESLGTTSHHIRSQIAYKFYDEEATTKLKEMEWSMNKTGALTPVAIFEPVEIDGTTIERASLHNVTIFKNLELSSDDEISVYKANMIIPQIRENLTKSHNNLLTPPAECPICGHKTVIEKTNDTEVLLCSNLNCKGKLLGKLNHFVSKEAIDIDGLSESTLEKFINAGFINKYKDIFELYNHRKEIINLDGFNTKSTDKLLSSIESSKNTTLSKFINALSIPLVGNTASKIISKYFKGNFNSFFEALYNPRFVWSQLENIGEGISNSITEFAKNTDPSEISDLANYFTFEISISNDAANTLFLSGQTFVITGDVAIYKNRAELKSKIESLGGKVSGSVSSKTNYLINNNINSTSSKNKKAKELGVKIITEEDFQKLIGE